MSDTTDHAKSEYPEALEAAYWSYMNDGRKGPYDIDAFMDAVRPLLAAAEARAALARDNDGCIKIADSDCVNAGGVVTSGANVRKVLDFMFPFGRPVDEILNRLNMLTRGVPYEDPKIGDGVNGDFDGRT